MTTAGRRILKDVSLYLAGDTVIALGFDASTGLAVWMKNVRWVDLACRQFGVAGAVIAVSNWRLSHQPTQDEYKCIPGGFDLWGTNSPMDQRDIEFWQQNWAPEGFGNDGRHRG